MKFPPDMIVRSLRADEWHLIEKRFTEQFACMPENPLQSIFYGVFLGDKLIGFAHLEKLFHLNTIYLEKEYRNEQFAEGVFDILDSEIPATFPAVIFPYKYLRKLLEKYKFVDKGKISVWRKEY